MNPTLLQKNTKLAVVDLGSNSFHLLIVELHTDTWHVLYRQREYVQLAAGLDDELRLTEDIQTRALSCLAQFRKILNNHHPQQVRIVGTNTLRVASNASHFLARARWILGHPIRVISGEEEARIIYHGATASLMDHDHTKRLVIDIGGGSTELIIGQGHQSLLLTSLPMGCVHLTQLFFRDTTRLPSESFVLAKEYAKEKIAAIKDRYCHLGWDICMACSGTAQAVFEVKHTHVKNASHIHLNDLQQIQATLNTATILDNVNFDGLRPERLPIFPAGLAILMGLFEALNISDMILSPGALREGIIWEMVHHYQRQVNELSPRYS